MPISKKNLLQHELIGLRAKVLESDDPSLEEKEGIIMDETKNTLTLKEGGSLKVLPKKVVSLSVTIPSGEKVKVTGRNLRVRPADRIKKFR